MRTGTKEAFIDVSLYGNCIIAAVVTCECGAELSEDEGIEELESVQSTEILLQYPRCKRAYGVKGEIKAFATNEIEFEQGLNEEDLEEAFIRWRETL